MAVAAVLGRIRSVFLASGVFLLVVQLMACSGQQVLAPVEILDDGEGPTPSGFYRVRSGDTLLAVSRRTGHSVSDLASWNQLAPPYPIRVGELLRVRAPNAGGRRQQVAREGRAVAPAPAEEERVAAAESRTPASKSKASDSRAAEPSGARTDATEKTRERAAPGKTATVEGVAWQWPIRGSVKQTYEAGNRSRQGIRIAATPGTRVGAAAAGSVVYSGSGLKGYGNLIIVKHNDRFLSVYGFNRRLIAKQGDKVGAGQVLAETGQAPNGDHLLHFEIRRDGATVDPLRYLPR